MSLSLDKSTWKRVRLGEVIRRSRTQVDPVSSGVERYVAGGHVDSEGVMIERWGRVGDGQMGSTFRYVFNPGQVLFVSARPYLRKVGVPDFSGVVADKTYVLDAIPENGLLQEFLPFLLSSEAFIEYATAEATGSMNPRLLWGPMQRYEFDLPPLEEQRCFADLLWAVERHQLTLVAEDGALRAALAQFCSHRFASVPTTRRLGELTATRSGPSFSAADVSEFPQGDSVPVLGIPNTKPDGSIDLSSVGYVSGLPQSTAKVDGASLILIRTNGNRDRIGNVYLPPTVAHGYAVSAFQFLMKVFDPADRKYIYWVLRQPGMQAKMSEAASGTTGLGNLAVRWLNEQDIPWPEDPNARTAIIGLIESQAAAADLVRAELSALATFRSSLLAGIFGSAK
ncbi:hypothetical protein ACFFWC_22960 [Plantactinospora siamensis]|uniref:Restriction endonuclease subunit S n=1 Tax=Plantactinospora siamensis TaxID=555372 RepID=A0ABV6NUE7_9ACTN